MKTQTEPLSLRLSVWLLALQVMLPALSPSAIAQTPSSSQTPTFTFAAAPACNPQLQCCQASPGTGTPGCSAAAGNPLNILTGNKFQTEVDMPALPGVLGLEIVRYYNSELAGLQGARGALGRGWRLSYDAQLVFSSADTQVITYITPDGTHIRYSKVQPAIAAAERSCGC